MFNLCRVCLASAETYEFDSIFDRNGKCANEIFLLSGLRVIYEVKDKEPALICPECTSKLEDFILLRNQCLETSKYFQKICSVQDIECQDTSEEVHLPIELLVKTENPEETEENSIEEYLQETEMIFEDELSQEELTDQVDHFLNVEILENEFQIPKKIQKDEVLNLSTFACTYCPRTFKTVTVLQFHLKSDHKQTVKVEKQYEIRNEPLGEYQCEICYKTLSGDYELKRHNRTVHENRRDHKCDFCGKMFGARSNLNNHMMKLHVLKDPSAPKRVKVPREKKERNLTFSKICHLCGKEFSHHSYVRSHLSLFHYKEQRTKCPVCDKFVNTHSDMKKHIREVHEKRKDYICGLCGKCFSQKPNLERHTRAAHSTERPHGCPSCGRRFAEKSQLKVHSMTHTGEKPFQCKFCEKTYRRSHHLKKHVKNAHSTNSDIPEGEGDIPEVYTVIPEVDADIGTQYVIDEEDESKLFVITSIEGSYLEGSAVE